MVTGRAAPGVHDHQRHARAEYGSPLLHGNAVPRHLGVPLPKGESSVVTSSPGGCELCAANHLTPLTEGHSSSCDFLLAPAGRGRKPRSALVGGEPQRPPAHRGDEETRRPPNRVRGGSAGPRCASLVWPGGLTHCGFLLLQEGVLRHHGEMGHQHQTGCQLAEQRPEQLHLDTV